MAAALKSLGRNAGWWALSRLLRLIRQTDDAARLYRRTELLGRLAYMLMRNRRRLLLENLRRAFPEWSPKRVHQTAGMAVANISRGFADLFYWCERPQLLKEHVRVENPELLDALVAGRSGLILLTGHVGMFPWVGVPFIARGLPFGAVARDPHDERLAGVFDAGRSALGYANIPDRPPTKMLRESLRILKAGGAVMFAFDMHPAGFSGVEVDFMGIPTPMFTGPVRLAARLRVPLVPAYAVWEPDRLHHRVTYYPAIEVSPAAADEDTAETRAVVSALAAWLSAVIRRYPEQYWWIHQRWR